MLLPYFIFEPLQVTRVCYYQEYTIHGDRKPSKRICPGPGVLKDLQHPYPRDLVYKSVHRTHSGDNRGRTDICEVESGRSARFQIHYPRIWMVAHSDIRSRHGAGSIETNSGLVMLVSDTSAWPGARPLTMFHRPLSIPLTDRLSRSITLLSPIL